MRRDTFLKSLAALAATGGLPLSALAATNLKMMIPANPGGGWDTTGRALGKALEARHKLWLKLLEQAEKGLRARLKKSFGDGMDLEFSAYMPFEQLIGTDKAKFGFEKTPLIGLNLAGVFEFGQFGSNGRNRPDTVHGFGDDAFAFHLTDVLLEITDGDATINRDLAFIRRLFARDHAKDGGFARAIGTHQTDFFAAVDGTRCFDEEDLFAVAFANGVEPNHGGAFIADKKGSRIRKNRLW